MLTATGLHYNFVRNVLHANLPLPEFNRVTYFTNNRRFLVGSILAFDNYTRPTGKPGLYALQFWPTDPVDAMHVSRCFNMLLPRMPFATQTLAYHPSGDLQEQLFVRQSEIYATKNVRTVATSEISKRSITTPSTWAKP